MDPMMGTKDTSNTVNNSRVQNKALNLENTGPEQGKNTRLKKTPRISELGRNKTQTGANHEVVKKSNPPK